MLVDAMEQHGHLDLDPEIKIKVLQVSAATIDRVLTAARLHIDGQRKRRKGIGSAIRHSIPVRTFADWRDPPPGFFETDMVEHCGGVKTEGEFVHTLTMTDIATGWTECVAMRVREQMLVVASFDTVAAVLPFAMLGVHRAASSRPSSSPTRCWTAAASCRWTGAGPGGTTCSSSACGRGVKYERVHLKAYDRVSAARADIADYLNWYKTPGVLIRAWTSSRPTKNTSPPPP